MAKTFVRCTSIEECMAGVAAGVLYFLYYGTWHRYNKSARIATPEIWEEHMAMYNTSILVDDDEDG